MLLKKLFFLAFSLFLLSACSNSSNKFIVLDTATIEGHPAWMMNSNIYEVNVRQYTAAGTFQAFSEHLERLKEMGVQTLWFLSLIHI